MKSQKTEENAPKSQKSVTIAEQEVIDAQQTINQGQDNSNRETYVIDQEESDATRFAATGGLAVILGQLVAYFNGRADIDDLDVLSFSLHHLFCRVDFLYRKALPILTEWTASSASSTPSYTRHMQANDVRHRQHIWTQLQKINRALDRMEPLCHLLSDATECILDSFDLTSEMLSSTENGQQPGSPLPYKANQASDAEGYPQGLSLLIVDQERWDQAFSAVTQSLLTWQGHYSKLVSFASQFANVLPATPSLSELDSAFATILDSAGAIFGDILPGFRAILADDDTAIAAILFDLMQQSDQLLVQFDSTLEPMNVLIKHFSIGSEVS